MEQCNKNVFVCMTKEKYEQMVKNEDHLKNMITELIRLNEEENRLKRHHRAYLHVRDYINVVCDADKKLLEKMQEEAANMPPVVLNSCDHANMKDCCCHQESCCNPACCYVGCEGCKESGECAGCGERTASFEQDLEEFLYDMLLMGMEFADLFTTSPKE